MFLSIFILQLELILWSSQVEELSGTTASVGDVCELDNSCIPSSTLPESQTEKGNVSETWKYNVSDSLTPVNESLINIYRINETNSTDNFDIDVSNATQNRSKSNNETKLLNTKFQIRLTDLCFCDEKKGSCDLNCCCDPDCLHVNRDLFKECNVTETNTEDLACPSRILNSPLLCIVRDNLYSRHFYPKHQEPFQTANVEKLLKRRNVFGWSFPELPIDADTDVELPRELKEYEIGSPVWIITNDLKWKKFRFPKSTLTSRDCENTEPIGFLGDEENVCTYRIRNVSKSACESDHSILNVVRYYANFSIVMNPNSTNRSTPLNCSHNCVPIKTFVCKEGDLKTCSIFNTTMKPKFEKNSCERAVTYVHYNLIHNGTEGITSAELYLQTGSVELVTNLLWSIPFKLTFQWVNQAHYYSLSGYPGYVSSRPIITGYLEQKKGKENVTENGIIMSNDKRHWLTYFVSNINGECLKTSRNNVLFRENIYTHCFVPVPKIRNIDHCEIFQKEIFNIMFGTYINISNVYVSSFGLPDVKDKNKWVPLFFDRSVNFLNESCFGIIISVKIAILHGLIGEHDDPQQSIIGVKVTGNAIDRNVTDRNKLKLSISVNFHDVTNPPSRIFAEPPTYEVKLPTDFFYPFFSKCSKLVESKFMLLLALATLFLKVF